MSFVGDLVCVHVIHDVRTYGEVQKKLRVSRHETLSVALWLSVAYPGAVRF